MKKFKEYNELLLCIGVILVIYYAYVLIFNKGSSLFWGDEADQVIQFYSNASELMKKGDLSFWNSSIGLGASEFTMFFTVLGSPSFYLTLLCPSKEFIAYLFPLIDMIRFLIIALLSYKWISKLVISKSAKLIGTLSFTFCGWMMYWMHFPYYMDTFIYLPILLYACEEMFSNKKYLLFSLIIAFVGILSLYQLYMISWLLFIYMLCRYFMINHEFEAKKFWCLVFKVSIYYLIGIGIGAIVIVPCFFILLTTNRIADASVNLLMPIDFLAAFRVLTSLVSPVINDFDYNIYSSPFINGNMDVYTVYNYSLIIFPLLVFQIFKIKFNGKKALLITTGILYCLLFFKFSYFIFNGNNSVRWSFFYNVFNCLLLVYIIENKNQWDLNLLKTSGILLSLFIIVCTIISRCFGLSSNNSELTQLYLIPLLIFLIIMYTVFLNNNIKLIYLFMCLEILLCLILRTFNGKTTLVADGSQVEYYHKTIFQDEIMEYIDTIDNDDIYRMEFDLQNHYGYNMPLANNYAGFSSYVSIYNYESTDFLENRFSNSWFVGYQPSKFLVKSLLGNRYLLTNPKSLEIPFGYKEIKEFENYSLFENSVDMNLGYATSQVSSKEDLDIYDTFIKDYIMMQSIVLEQDSYGDYQYPHLVENNLVNGSFNPNAGIDGVYIIDYSSKDPYSLCKYNMYYDGDNYDERNSAEVGYYALKLNKEYNDIFVYCASESNPNNFVPYNVYWLSNDEIRNLYENLDMQDKFYNIVKNNDKISADITISNKDKIVATSLAYDEGWSVKIDGEKVETKKVNYGFLGFDIKEGKHSVKFSFEPKGFTIGMLTSIISIIIYCTLVISKLQSRRKS